MSKKIINSWLKASPFIPNFLILMTIDYFKTKLCEFGKECNVI